MACRIIPFSLPKEQDSPVSRTQATVLRKALNVAFTAWADANPLEVSKCNDLRLLYYKSYVGTAFELAFGCASVAKLPATLYPTALRWIAHATEHIDFPAWWSFPCPPHRGE